MKGTKNRIRKCYVNAVDISLNNGQSIIIAYEPLNQHQESNRVVVTNKKGEVRTQAFGSSRFLLKIGHKE